MKSVKTVNNNEQVTRIKTDFSSHNCSLPFGYYIHYVFCGIITKWVCETTSWSSDYWRAKVWNGCLVFFLSNHPDIAINAKTEIEFFSTNYNLGFDWYKDRLPCTKPDQVLIERSSNYFRQLLAIDRIWRMDTSTKLILVVCEPVRRAISHFAMSVERKILPNTTFEKHVFKTQQGLRKPKALF